MREGDSNRSKGWGIVEFDTVEEAAAAIGMYIVYVNTLSYIYLPFHIYFYTPLNAVVQYINIKITRRCFQVLPFHETYLFERKYSSI